MMGYLFSNLWNKMMLASPYSWNHVSIFRGIPHSWHSYLCAKPTVIVGFFSTRHRSNIDQSIFVGVLKERGACVEIHKAKVKMPCLLGIGHVTFVITLSGHDLAARLEGLCTQGPSKYFDWATAQPI